MFFCNASAFYCTGLASAVIVNSFPIQAPDALILHVAVSHAVEE